MQFDYFSILRWKKGEQTAAARLPAQERNQLLPIAEIQELEKGIAQPKLVQQLAQADGEFLPIAFDLKPVAQGGPVPIPYLARLASHLQDVGLEAWPVVHANDALANPADLFHFKGQHSNRQ